MYDIWKSLLICQSSVNSYLGVLHFPSRHFVVPTFFRQLIARSAILIFFIHPWPWRRRRRLQRGIKILPLHTTRTLIQSELDFFHALVHFSDIVGHLHVLHSSNSNSSPTSNNNIICIFDIICIVVVRSNSQIFNIITSRQSEFIDPASIEGPKPIAIWTNSNNFL